MLAFKTRSSAVLSIAKLNFWYTYIAIRSKQISNRTICTFSFVTVCYTILRYLYTDFVSILFFNFNLPCVANFKAYSMSVLVFTIWDFFHTFIRSKLYLTYLTIDASTSGEISSTIINFRYTDVTIHLDLAAYACEAQT